MGNGKFSDANIESEGDGALDLDIHQNTYVIAYLQERKVLVGLTSKECDHVVDKAKWFKWEGNSFLHTCTNEHVHVVLHQK
jgi:fructose-1,6-bisphosphatase